jgi:hypothetical protein
MFINLKEIRIPCFLNEGSLYSWCTFIDFRGAIFKMEISNSQIDIDERKGTVCIGSVMGNCAYSYDIDNTGTWIDVCYIGDITQDTNIDVDKFIHLFADVVIDV